ncbi:YwmB family TATA-box binding protein [Paenibacillus sedimenti]|uniref:YwmB family TATA-box binding protein n=1 Tax=Paenibacillus sedimenti TaxID=2770274 RepID=A0A926QMK1_9BACL|nr:YwmB family TATA-box binding protein [Paenibacillus sedimenti]MBD0383772.1 YwmB family TATA-box binding protein [Paenibacillus sedimenti]
MQKFWLLSIIWISITGIIFGWVRHVDARGGEDTPRLLNSIKPYMVNEYQITLKYTGYYGTCGGTEEQLLQAGKRLSEAFGLPRAETLSETNSHSIYKEKVEVVPGTVATLTVASPQGQSACYMILQLDASQASDPAKLVKWQEEKGNRLADLGIKGEWNIMVQGYVLSGQTNTVELIESLVQEYRGKIVESYTDTKTVSVSLAADQFHSSIKSGNQTVNLQIALHQESTTGLWRLTAGTPIITIEY